MRRLADESGASLIIALAFVTTIAIAMSALAGLTLTSQQTANVQAAHGKLVNALDGAVQAAIENVRVQAGGPACPATALTVADLNGFDASVSCTGTGAELELTAEELDPPVCGPPASPQPQPLRLAVTATFSTIGGADGPRLARVSSWRLLPRPACPSPS